MPWRRCAVLLGSAIIAIIAACSDEEAGPSGDPDAGPVVPPPSTGVCPTAAPNADERCLVPEGTTCAFERCGSQIVECRGGAWRYAGNPEPRPSCPPEAPPAESKCPDCWPVDTTCIYGTCEGADASANRARVSCVDGKWQIGITACPSPSDAGADVQGDADANVD